MPTDLFHMYTLLAGDVADTALPSAESLRDRADRRARVRIAGVSAFVAVVVVIVVVGVSMLVSPPPTALAPATLGPPTASPDVSRFIPSPDVSASVSPSTALSASAPIPADAGAIPDSAFFTQPAADVVASISSLFTVGEQFLPELCQRAFPSDATATARRTKRYYFRRGQPEVTGDVDHTITIYRPGGAEAAMREFVDGSCVTDSNSYYAIEYRVLAAPQHGDESVLLGTVWTPLPGVTPQPMAPTTRTTVFYTWVIRLGNVVAILHAHGWEGIDPNREVADTYADLAVAAIRAWRH